MASQLKWKWMGVVSAGVAVWFGVRVCAEQPTAPGTAAQIETARETLGKWMETQQIISRERKDWQQGKEILQARVDLVQKEIATLEEKIRETSSSVEESNKRKSELETENQQLKVANADLVQVVGKLEVEVKKMHTALPDPIRNTVTPLFQRIPDDPSKTKASAAERFQNVLGILNELNKANQDITVSYEVHNMADGKLAEVQALYIGLAQAYYVSALGEAGIGRPTPTGWKWESSPASARDILLALEIMQGKHTPAFVPLPLKIP